MDLITLAAKDYGNVAENMGTYGGNVTGSGLVIVFAMLVLLVIIISVFGMIMSRLSGAPKKEKPKKEPKAVAAPVAVAAPAPVASEEDDVIAAISAAVMMMYEGTGKTPVIRSIRPAAKGVRSAWGMAGVMNNTRPF
ncbi:MAG: OadG family protein [Clostridia bacterium]|nr:OadG family protein [Clostridia bacterium]